MRGPFQKRTESDGINEQRIDKKAIQSKDSGIESLKMPNLEDPFLILGHLNQFLGFVQCGRHRLLQQDIDTTFNKISSHLKVDRGRDGDAHSLDLVEEILIVHKGTRRKTVSDFVNPCLVNIGHADQIDLGTSCVFLRMERTKISDTDDTNLKLLHLSADPPF